MFDFEFQFDNFFGEEDFAMHAKIVLCVQLSDAVSGCSAFQTQFIALENCHKMKFAVELIQGLTDNSLDLDF